MHLAFDIFQGIGIAAAIGIRPFLPSLAAGALAAGGVELHFDHTSYGFLQSIPFLLVMLVAAALLVVLDAGAWGRRLHSGPVASALAAIALILGALFFAGSLVRDHHAAWPGWIGGVLCAGVGLAAARPFLSRLRSRLDEAAAAVGLPVISDGSALLVAVLAVVAPPLGLIALLLLLWLLAAGRGRGDVKYAGLRILR
ncbi:MAG TPA: DUF4126 family protein [Solirubrobacteraceae bacterium]|nr:DUF4126 family protein [Solirubrobacteraceae bacterium]